MQSKNENMGLLKPEQAMGGAAQFNAVFRHLTGKMQTIMLVEITSVQGEGVEPVGSVSVRPMVSMLDGADNIIEHGTIHNVPFFRLQGGKNAVVLDPQVGDIGLCAFCSRDISAVKRTKAAAPPASKRQYDWSDGLYIGGFLNDTPVQYIQFAKDHIKVYSPNKIILDAPDVETTGNLAVAGDVTVEKSITAQGIIKSLADVMAKAISLITHKHPGVQNGSSSTGPAQ
ncbi:Gp138 family membrane-puncturing spike protein [Acinetobacter larvae]|uniref:Phage protein Gp138 N-terminal domain-containing protein n=1 Tax=Acinetobacter larvae TaxID=1789224 RepID=A0A1B2LZI9_9GAMM|nr:Gp138 family membrane-puncturing spike protein [Acinetobacter larvae]AOA58337.1 hypothetical protein BFG52_08200 [Acinetobacter larvae]